MKIVLLILIMFFLKLGSSFTQAETPEKYISKFEKKIKIDTIKSDFFKKINKCFIENGDSKEKQTAKRYFIFTNDGIQNVGTDILYFNNNQIVSLGTWQVKTDSFRLGNTDTLIIFYNPYKKQNCRVVYDNSSKVGAFSIGYITGYAFEWTNTNKLKTETIIDKSKNTIIIKRDTLSGKIISREILK